VKIPSHGLDVLPSTLNSTHPNLHVQPESIHTAGDVVQWESASLPCPGSWVQHRAPRKEEEEEDEKEKKFSKHLARLYLQTPSIESFTRFASVNTQRPHS
jgi:hypothetical protein